LFLSASAAIGLAACHQPLSSLDAAGPDARVIAQFGWLAMGLFLAATLVVWALLAWAALRRRGTLETHAPIDAPGPRGWIYAGGLMVPALVFAALFVLMIVTMHRASGHQVGNTPAEIRVTGHQWFFEAEYAPGRHESVRASTEIHVPVGRTVDVDLVSADVIHSFWVPRLTGKIDLVPGMVNRVRLRADRPGTYEGECAEFCGVQHAHMRLQVVAEAAPDYARWLAEQRAPASEPTGEAARRGQRLFLEKSCALCHTVRGTAARAAVGPDLTHLASRSRFAGAWLANDRANLQAWVVHAQSLKPGALMPDLGQFDGQELNDLVSYLETLQ
jgi:cytochrome c oxidase subunit 2